MQGFWVQENKLIWEQDHEIVQIEPWGQDSLRVGATMETHIRDDFPGALPTPAYTLAQIKIAGENAYIRNGKLAVEEGYMIIRELMFMRERLRPYIMEQMGRVHEHRPPPVRPLFSDFPEEQNCWGLEDQFMFGPDLLVEPVLHEGAPSRRVYLHAGSDWRDAWTDVTLEGGQWIEADAPLARIPLYLRNGRILSIRAQSQ